MRECFVVFSMSALVINFHLEKTFASILVFLLDIASMNFTYPKAVVTIPIIVLRCSTKYVKTEM